MKAIKVKCSTCEGTGFEVDLFSLPEPILFPEQSISLDEKPTTPKGRQINTRNFCKTCNGIGYQIALMNEVHVP